MTTPGDTLRKIRIARGITQRALGDAAGGLTSAAVSDWERGRSSPKRDAALAVDALLDAGGEIIKAYGYSVDRPTIGFNGELPDVIAKLPDRLAVIEAKLGVVSPQAPDQPLTDRVATLEEQMRALALNVEWLVKRAMQDDVDAPVETTDEPSRAVR